MTRTPLPGPVVSRRGRWALLAVLGFVIVPLVYAVAVLTPLGQRAEDAALGGVRESDLFGSDTALNVISVPVILLLVVVMVAVAFARRRLTVGLGAGVVVLASAATSTLVKHIAVRPEIAQSETPNSFPSGHATIALAALFGVLMVTPRRFRPVVTLVGAAYAVFVANQTVVYGWHRVSDIVGASAIALLVLTGCMKHSVARGSSERTSRTSAIEATSKWVIPESHRICSKSGEGFALTAYIDVPGNFSAKKRAARAAACGRLRMTG